MGDTIYIVGGGPSLLNYNWELLKDFRCIAVNRSYRVIPWAEVVYFTDTSFFEKHKDKGLLDHEGILVTISSRVQHPSVVVLGDTGVSGLETTPGRLRGGRNSGYAAINLAVHMGAKRIVLLGMDMHSDTVSVTRLRDRQVRQVPGRTHWHEGYNRNVTPRTYAKMIPHFATLVEPLNKLGIEVINASPDSRITVFPKIPLTEAHLVGTSTANEHA